MSDEEVPFVHLAGAVPVGGEILMDCFENAKWWVECFHIDFLNRRTSE
jgi:hypothetical protein